MIATAMMISKRVKARRLLTGSINIKRDLLGLLDSSANPSCRQRYAMDFGHLSSGLVVRYSGHHAGLNPLDLPVTGIDPKFHLLPGQSRRGLDFSHSIRQNQADAIFLGVERG